MLDAMQLHEEEGDERMDVSPDGADGSLSKVAE
jgi:hypothetical protein